TNGVATNATNVQPGDYVDFSGDKNISVSHDRTKVKVELNDELKDIKSIIGAGEGAGSISFADGGKVKVNDVIIEKGGKITGVAAGTADTDAVNYGQLKDVKAEAGKHTTLSNGKNTTVESTVKDGQTDYKVNVAGDLTDITSVANGDSKINLNKDSIIISNGNKYFAITNSGIGMSYIGADYSAKSIMLGENGTTISGGLNVAGSKITG
ncbi:hemagglutinin, partial [Phascolarctobacterium succinatutens YIT 12067]